MQPTIDRILDQRQHRVSRASTARMVGVSVVLHAILTVVAFWMPKWSTPPPKKLEFVSMMIVPPKALGIEQPPPPTRRTEPKPEPLPPEPPPPEPPPPEPKKPEPKKPEPKSEPAKPLVPDVPILPTQKPLAKPEKPKDLTPPPPTAPAPPAEPAKRQGSPFGNPFGSSSSNAVVGVEDPNFTYGYYLDRVVARIESNWTRPPVGSEVKNAHVYFRILRSGKVSDVRLVSTSGSDFFDQAALRAVEASSPLPPLPTSYAKDELGIQLIVK